MNFHPCIHSFSQNHVFAQMILIGQEPGTFIQLKSHKRFDGLDMLGLGQKSIFHVAAGSHPVRVAGGSQNRGPKKVFIQLKSHKDKTCWISLPGGYLW